MATKNIPGHQVNVGTAEKPVWISEDQVSNPGSSFWRGVADGGTLVGNDGGGIDLDKALNMVQRSGQSNAKTNS